MRLRLNENEQRTWKNSKTEKRLKKIIMFKYNGERTSEVEKLLEESTIILDWNNPEIVNIIISKKCPNCKNNLLYADRWYNIEQAVIFKRLCPSCKQSFILSGYFEEYYNSKQYFISMFRMKGNYKPEKKRY